MKAKILDILDDAMVEGQKLSILTQKRGVIIGVPQAVDEYETDDERFGYFIRIGSHELDTVFLDEIVRVEIA